MGQWCKGSVSVNSTTMKWSGLALVDDLEMLGRVILLGHTAFVDFVEVSELRNTLKCMKNKIGNTN